MLLAPTAAHLTAVTLWSWKNDTEDDSVVFLFPLSTVCKTETIQRIRRWNSMEITHMDNKHTETMHHNITHGAAVGTELVRATVTLLVQTTSLP